MIPEAGFSAPSPGARYHPEKLRPIWAGVLEQGRFRVRIASSPVDIARAQRFRASCFELSREMEADCFDAISDHVLIEDRHRGDLVGYFRMNLCEANAVAGTYSGQFYDLSPLQQHPGPMLEIGRFCICPNEKGPDVLRLAWAFIAACVDRSQVCLLFGCTSFPEACGKKHRSGLQFLARRYVAPKIWCPKVKSAEFLRLEYSGLSEQSQVTAWSGLPPLLRSYLAMGGWVSDHAVVDRALDTLHVFTGLEVSRIPMSRKARLRAVYKQCGQSTDMSPTKAVDLTGASA